MADDGFVSMADTLEVHVAGDVVRVRNQRLMTLRDLNALLEIYAQVRAKHGVLFATFDCSHAQGIEREARQAMTSEGTLETRADATAIFGAPFAIRILSSMIERARVGLGRAPTGVRFFDNEAQALAHIDEQRCRIQAKR